MDSQVDERFILAIDQEELTLSSILSIKHPSNPAITFCKNWIEGHTHFSTFTSGSTGTPKEIILSRDQLAHSANNTVRTFGLTYFEHALVCLPFESIASKMMLIRGMMYGWKCTLVAPSSTPFDSTSDRSFTFAAFAPIQLPSFIHHVTELTALKCILLGGNTVSEVFMNEIQKIPIPVIQTYGMTETASHVAYRYLNTSKKTSRYQPMSDTLFKTDERGCACILSKVTNNRWLTTNDIVSLYPDGSFDWLGRADFVINSGGIKIILEETENSIKTILSNNNIYQDFLLTGIPNPSLGEELVLVWEKEPSISTETLIELIKEKLPKFHLPKKTTFINDFPKKGNKFDRIALKRLVTEKLSY